MAYRSPQSLSILFAAFVATSLPAQIWTGAGSDNNWTTPQNWAEGIAPTSSSNTWIQFVGSPPRTTPFTDTNLPWVLNRIDLINSNYGLSAPFTLSGNQISFRGATPKILNTATASPQIIVNDIDIPDSDLTIDSFGHSITITGHIGGHGGLIVIGGLILGAPNDYQGQTTIGGTNLNGTMLGGQISITDANSLGTTDGAVVVRAGSLRLSGGINVIGKLLILDGGALTSTSANNTWSGAIANVRGGDITSMAAGDSLTVGGAFDGQGNDLYIRGAGSIVISGPINNLNQRGLTKFGTGTLTLSGLNSNIHQIIVYDGAVIAAQDNAVPSDTFIQLIPNTGNGNIPAYPTLKIEQDTTISGIRSYASGGIATVQLGPHTLTSNQQAYSSFAGTITGSGSVVKEGPGILELSGPNNYSGGTFINDGVMRFDSLGAIAGSGANVKISNGAIVTTFVFAIDQAFLNRINPSSIGTVAPCTSSSNSLDFGAAGLKNVRFGACGSVAYGGTITPANSVYRLGGAGGTLNLTALNALSGDASLEIGPSSSAAGTVILSNDNTLTGPVSVSGGLLQVSSSALKSGPIGVMSGTTLHLYTGTINSTTVTIDPGGLLTGCGTINADVVNNGTVSVNCSGALNITGNITNNGTIGVYNGSTLVATGSFINNGVLDLLTSPQTVLPSDFVNNGTVIDSSNVAIQTIANTGNTFMVTIRSFTGHSYQLQRTASLAPAPVSWQYVGPSQAGTTGQILTFTDSNATGSQLFYRVQLAP